MNRMLLWQYYQIPLYAVDLRRAVNRERFVKPDLEPRYWPACPDGWLYDPTRRRLPDFVNR